MSLSAKSMESLIRSLQKCASLAEKIAFLEALPSVSAFFQIFPEAFLKNLSPECLYILQQLVAIGQWERVQGGAPFQEKSVRELLEKLLPIDDFYREMGGLIGYQFAILECLNGKIASQKKRSIAYHPPIFIDISIETEEVSEAIFAGLKALPQMAEMVPLGGAADRLHLIDEETGLELPAAKLPFAGRSLLEGLIRDLQAREYLFFKLYGRRVITPIALMTSQEKDNHRHVVQLCETARWFGRPPDAFRLFAQPLVPTVDKEGNWCLTAPFKPLLKPSGHGAIWKLARDKGVFAWLEGLGRKKALIRQINNPIAGLDYGFFAFVGHGVRGGKLFGFASCPRLICSAEGVNVLVEKNQEEIVLSNIEYCDFAKFGIEDCPIKEGYPYSRFSSNTNILFADLSALLRAVEASPHPGLLVNLRKTSYITGAGEKREEATARLESTMQNIADVFVEKKGKGLETKYTFVTYNHRHKTIATAKKAFLPGGALQETPENCFYELLGAARELLEICGFELPPRHTLEEYLWRGPDVLFLYHPALGPLYSVIQKKLRKGRLGWGTDFQLEIADLDVEELNLEGSLLIRAEQVMGHFDEKGELHYSEKTGRCTLKNAVIRNRGVCWERSTPFWKNQLQRKERLEIVLRGCSEFIAEDVVFEGAARFEVEDGMRMRVGRGGKIETERLLKNASPFWRYEWKKGVSLERESGERTPPLDLLPA